MLEAQQLCMHYKDALVLNELSFTVAPGEIFCLLGQNGAGKTTTINIFLGLLQPSSGAALINTIPTSNRNAIREFIAYIPEIVHLYGALSGVENLKFFSKLAGFTYSEKQLRDYLHQANLQEEAHTKKVATYSKGMRQKVGIAIALAKNAAYILMDEPTSGLDPKASVEFARTCKTLSAKGVGVLMATHDIFNAVNIGSTVGILREGKLIYTADTSKTTAQELQDLYIETI